MEKNTRMTLADLGAKLGLSTATISLALRNNLTIAEETRKRVREAAREFGYIYNRQAASLRTSSSGMIAIGFNDITNPYFAEMFNAIEKELEPTGQTLLLGTYNENLERQRKVFQTLSEHRPDGIIMTPASGTVAADFDILNDNNIPIVQISRYIKSANYDCVRSEDALGTQTALQFLFDTGHKHIGFIGGNLKASTGYHRHTAYKTMMEASGLQPLIYEGATTREVGYKGLVEVLLREPRLTACLCFNDLTAFGALLALKNHNREAGVNFSLIGCDDVNEATLWSPALTTLKNFQDQMGAKAAELLLQRIKEPNRPMSHITIAPQLVIRGTTCSV